MPSPVTALRATANLDAAKTPDWTRTVLHLGDTHHGASNVATRAGIAQAALQALVPSSLAALVQVGDMVEASPVTAQDATAVSYINSLPAQNRRAIIGNHDVETARTGDAAATAWGFNARNWTLDLSFARLIGISPPSTLGDGAITFDQTALDYLDAALAGTSLPCLIFGHAPLFNTVLTPSAAGMDAGYDSSQTGMFANPDASLRAIFAARSTAKAYISGHTHSFMSAAGFVKLESVGGGRSILVANSSAIRGQHNPAALTDPIIAIFTTVLATALEVRVYDCSFRRWAQWPDTGAYVKRVAMPA